MDKLIAALQAAGEDKAKQVAALKAEGGGLFQAVFQEGHDTGYGKKHGELTTAQTRVTALEGELTTVKDEVTKLKSNPDVAALHTQYAGEIKTIKDAALAKETALANTLRAERTNAARATLKAALKSGDKVLVDAFADVLAEKGDVIGRIKVGDDGAVTVLQAGKEIPFAAATAEAALAMLADELKGTAPAEFVKVGTDVGGGQRRVPGAPPATKNTFDKIREDVKASASPKDGIKPHGAFAGLAPDAITQ